MPQLPSPHCLTYDALLQCVRALGCHEDCGPPPDPLLAMPAMYVPVGYKSGVYGLYRVSVYTENERHILEVATRPDGNTPLIVENILKYLTTLIVL